MLFVIWDITDSTLGYLAGWSQLIRRGIWRLTLFPLLHSFIIFNLGLDFILFFLVKLLFILRHIIIIIRPIKVYFLSQILKLIIKGRMLLFHLSDIYGMPDLDWKIIIFLSLPCFSRMLSLRRFWRTHTIIILIFIRIFSIP
jgi:hypothetical protein